MGEKWRLANRKKPKGTLDKTDNFLPSTDNIRCCMVSVPLEMDAKLAKQAASSLISSGMRSFEIWWDGVKKELSIALVAESEDLAGFKQAFSNMYPNADFADIDDGEKMVPEWFDRNEECRIFDVSTYHGHYTTVFDTSRAHQLMTQLANTIQLARYGWVQFVFQSYDFTSTLQKHVAKMDRMNHEVSRTNYVGIGEGIIDQVFGDKSTPHDHPEKGYDFFNNYRGLHKHATLKMQGSHAVMSVRGLIQSDTDVELSFDEIESLPVETIRSNDEHLTKYKYNYENFYDKKDFKKADHIKIGKEKTNRQRINIFESRLIPDPKPYLSKMLSSYFNKKFLSGYVDREPLPFLLVLPTEMSLLVHLPDGRTPNIRTTRGVVLPSQQSRKAGFNMGYFGIAESFNAKKYYGMFGMPVVSSDVNAAVISPKDFSTHIYSVAATGGGKSSIAKCIAKHLEMANLYHDLPRTIAISEIISETDDEFTKDMLSGLPQGKTLDEMNIGWPNAFIYFDPKGDDSEAFVRQCEKRTFGKGRVHLLDPAVTNFSINPLELPSYDKSDPQEREKIVSQYVGFFFEMIKEWYGNEDSFVRMNRIFRNLLQYVYLENDAPTFADIYKIILNIQSDKAHFLPVMYNSLGRPSEELDMALNSIAGMEAKAYEPVLNRLESFVVDKTLRQMFCVPHSTISFEELIRPGNYTVVRFAESDIPLNVINLAMQTFVLKLWFTILERSSKTSEDERTQVVLALDEFQKVKGVGALDTMIEQSRSKGLGLILTHQNLKQLDDNLLSKIANNFGVQLAGSMEGMDAQRLGTAWDPKYAQEIKQMIATQPKFRWIIRMAAPSGEEQPLPVQFWTHYDPENNAVLKSNLTLEEYREFVKDETAKYESKGDVPNIFERRQMKKDRWLASAAEEPPLHDHWRIMLILLKNDLLKHAQISEKFGTTPRDELAKIYPSMIHLGLIEKSNKEGEDLDNKENRSPFYKLTDETQKRYFDIDSKEIGTADDIPAVTKKAIRYYRDRGFFLTVAPQKVRKGKDRTDLVAYDYVNQIPISVEIESITEVDSHPEHVAKNMVKWPELGFSECHVWSFNRRIRKIKKAIPEMQEFQDTPKETLGKVRLFMKKKEKIT